MSMHLDIVTPEKKVFSDEVENVYLPGADGEMGILPQHAGLVTALQAGELRYLHNGETGTLAVGSGFAEISFAPFGIRSKTRTSVAVEPPTFLTTN